MSTADDVPAELDRLAGQVRQLVALVQPAEWACACRNTRTGYVTHSCPWCKGDHPQTANVAGGHADGCPWVAARAAVGW